VDSATGLTVSDSAPVIVIGGGAFGPSIAFHLTGLGIQDVLAIDRFSVGDGTTWHSGGLVGRTAKPFSRDSLPTCSTYPTCAVHCGPTTTPVPDCWLNCTRHVEKTAGGSRWHHKHPIPPRAPGLARTGAPTCRSGAGPGHLGWPSDALPNGKSVIAVIAAGHRWWGLAEDFVVQGWRPPRLHAG
jgi:hypothetical protein